MKVVKNRLIVHLLVRKGSKGIEGDNINERNIVKIDYGTIDCKTIKDTTIEWKNYLKNCKVLGAYTVEVVKVEEVEKGVYKQIETPKFIVDQVKAATSLTQEVLTKEQLEIKELKAKMAKMEAFMAGKSVEDNVEADSGDQDEEVTKDKAIEMYKLAFDGKSPHHMKSVESILRDIKNKK